MSFREREWVESGTRFSISEPPAAPKQGEPARGVLFSSRVNTGEYQLRFKDGLGRVWFAPGRLTNRSDGSAGWAYERAGVERWALVGGGGKKGTDAKYRRAVLFSKLEDFLRGIKRPATRKEVRALLTTQFLTAFGFAEGSIGSAVGTLFNLIELRHVRNIVCLNVQEPKTNKRLYEFKDGANHRLDNEPVGAFLLGFNEIRERKT